MTTALATIQLKNSIHKGLTTSVTVEGKKHVGCWELEDVLARLIEKFGKVAVAESNSPLTLYVYGQ